MKLRTIIILALGTLVLLSIPVLLIARHAAETRQPWQEVLRNLTSRGSSAPATEQVGASTASRFTPMSIGHPPETNSAICHVEAVDLDRDGLLDVIVSDCTANAITWIRQYPQGVFTEIVLANEIMAPAHTQAFDIDLDGDLDILVASLGSLPPSNDRIGSVIILENDGAMNFTPRIIAQNIARVADVRGADLNGNGEMDLAVAQFGADDGETSWFENLGDWPPTFRMHTLQSLNGTINVEPVDMNGNGHIDLVTIVSQEWEEIYIHYNDGRGNFTPVLIYSAANEDYGSSGISVVDLDGDGDLDVLYTNGDAFDYTPPRPRPWHGVQWLENVGPPENPQFVFRRIADFPGAYSPRAADFDGDGDLDIVVVSGFNRWENHNAQSIVWFENRGGGEFVMHNIARAPTHLVTVAIGDFNGDGLPDLVTGGIHYYPPYDRLGRVTLWMNSHPSAGAHD